jgi:hypothetical protein
MTRWDAVYLKICRDRAQSTSADSICFALKVALTGGAM